MLYDRQGADSLQVSPSLLRTARIRIRLLTCDAGSGSCFPHQSDPDLQPLVYRPSTPLFVSVHSSKILTPMRIRIGLFTLMRICIRTIFVWCFDERVLRIRNKSFGSDFGSGSGLKSVSDSDPELDQKLAKTFFPVLKLLPSLIFKHKKAALPQLRDLATTKVRS